MIETGAPPATAQATFQEAKWLASHLNKNDLSQTPPFSFRNMGTLAYIGSEKALMQIPHDMHDVNKRKSYLPEGITGRMARLVWNAAYITMSISWHCVFRRLVSAEWIGVQYIRDEHLIKYSLIGSAAWAEVSSSAFLPAPAVFQSCIPATRNFPSSGIMASSQPQYVAIAERKQAELAAAIPAEWQLPAHLIPAGMLSPAESITEGPKQYGRVNVMNIPRTCGILTAKELEITENYDVRGLVSAMTERKLKAEDVTRAFCKRAAVSHQLTRCLTEPLFDRALRRAQELDYTLRKTGQPVGPLHGLPVSMKDTFNIKGIDSSIGLSALAFKPALENADLVNLLQSLGAIVIAKTNIPQTLATLDSCNHLFGRTLNPLNRQWTAGGSTGGEGALVAMRGSMVGFGTDIGGSIRVPAMCQGIYGFKPSNGRVPYGGQESGQLPGKGRISLQPVAGPLARSVADLGAVMGEIVPRAELFGEDGIPGFWPAPYGLSLATPRNFTIGILKTDGLVTPLPPVARVLDEVACHLRRTPGVEVVDIPLPPALPKCQGLAGRLMGVDDGSSMLDKIENMGESLIPWLQGRMKRGKDLSIEQLAQLQAQRAEIEKEMLKMWTLHSSNKARRVDAIICPVAPHPVPQMDRYNAVGYTSTFVLLDYPAGTVPVRPFVESDLELGRNMDAPVLGSWDKANRQLWNEKTVDRRVYLDSPLSVQVVTPKQHDYQLFQAMEIVDRAVQGNSGSVSAKL
ncbi:hypothetical protein N7532_011757 [Penicillium argentinense]|uniref:Amidase domain-containing protein n=1 Tax=Penicillium argentinense TaxID=1131581 RepID=A0A9W9EJ30_9EURO|nr:uncharacterized protein N7532_011757 [Penicillium argentinense]KAJ5082714.1 hypothetical protein N7532_011757 [Penicillium argentinense]